MEDQQQEMVNKNHEQQLENQRMCIRDNARRTALDLASRKNTDNAKIDDMLQDADKIYDWLTKELSDPT